MGAGKPLVQGDLGCKAFVLGYLPELAERVTAPNVGLRVIRW